MSLPTELILSLEGLKGFNREAFEKVHNSGEQVTSIRVNPIKEIPPNQVFSTDTERIPWSRYGYYLKERPSFTFDPLFHAGSYYVQEASGMFLEQAIIQTVDLSKPLKVLDLCASPGGKSTHIQSLLGKESLLVSNEVIRARAQILRDNMIKWGSNNVVVTRNDPAEFKKLENYFDLIVVDAPCSGSGLFRRDPGLVGEWSENAVEVCSQRQKRILADVWPSLKKNGSLIYCTCSYSQEEDEDIMNWMMNQMDVASCQLTVPLEWNIVSVQTSSSAQGYRFWPYQLKGEGFFLTCFQKRDGEYEGTFKRKIEKKELNHKERAIVDQWVSAASYLMKHNNTIYAWPNGLESEFYWLLQNLGVIYSGTIIGELMRDKLVPDHSLAMSDLVNESIPSIELNYDESISYLKRSDLNISSSTRGWHLVRYKGLNLGWINVLPTRVNNYYPKELRIIKDR